MNDENYFLASGGFVKKSGMMLSHSIAAALLVAASGTTQAVSFQVPGTNTNIDVGGYAKLDIIWNSISAGNSSQANIEYVPSSIPLDPQDSGEEGQVVFNGRESRIWIKTSTPTDEEELKTHLEFDFDTNEGNQLVSNSHGARIRHAYATYNNMLFGRTWSLFMALPSLPDTNDFGGPTGDIFVRQAQLQFTWPMAGNHSWQLGIENPETFNRQGIAGCSSGGLSCDDDQLPDVIVRYNAPHWSVAGLFRSFNVEEAAVDDSDSGVGLQFAGNLPFGNGNRFQWQLNAGSGIGRYMSLATHPDVVVNGSRIEALDVVGGFAGVQLKTGGSGNARVNIVYGFTSADDPAPLAGSGTITEKTNSLHLNYMWNSSKKVRHGIELIHANREVYSGADGDLTRVQWSSRFLF
ncbi:MAG: hypothetical protein Kow006_05250 [Gammaproteobacteria bacterium]